MEEGGDLGIRDYGLEDGIGERSDRGWRGEGARVYITTLASIK